MQVFRRNCTAAFRAALMRRYPALAGDEELRKLVAYFVWAAPDAEGYRLVHQELLLRLQTTRHRGGLSGAKLLSRFERLVTHLEYAGYLDEETGELREYDAKSGKARRVKVLWPEDVAQLIEDEKALSVKHRQEVQFVSGKVLTKNSLTDLRKEAKAEAERVSVPVRCKEQADHLEMVNSVPARRFAVLRERAVQVIEVAKAELEGHALASQVEALESIYEQPQPFFKTVPGSVRIYEDRSRVTFLKRRYREMLTEGWIEYDLKASQLASAAYLWDVPLLKAVFERGESPWSFLIRELGATPEVKPALKKGIYGICYGAGQRKVFSEMMEQGATEELVNRFWSLPAVQELLDARKRQLDGIMERIRRGEELVSVTGAPLVAPKGEHITAQARSVLAQEMQTIELFILTPALRIAADENVLGFTQHDGFSAVFSDPRRRPTIERKLIEAVDEAAKRYGVRTGLEVKFNGTPALAA